MDNREGSLFKNKLGVMKIKEYIGKRIIISVKPFDEVLIYNALVLSVSDTHITFKDKYNKIFSFRLEHIIEISGGLK